MPQASPKNPSALGRVLLVQLSASMAFTVLQGNQYQHSWTRHLVCLEQTVLRCLCSIVP